MLAIRRTSLPLRNCGLHIRASVAAFPDSELPIAHMQTNDGIMKFPELGSERCLSFKGFYRRKYTSSNLFLVRCSLSSQASARGGGEEDGLEDEFSENENEDGCDDSESFKDELEISEPEIDVVEKAPSRKRVATSLVNSIIATQGLTVRDALDKWIEEGNKLGRSEIYLALANLRRLRMYGRALQFSEWLEARKQLEFAEKEYASHLDLIAKVQGLNRAENYIEKIPKSFRGELVYRTFLANCVQANNDKKAEAVFNKMRDLEFPLTVFVCNQLILLYKRTDKKKIADVLLLMESENLKPTLFTYKLLIDVKGKFNDIQGIEALLETMKTEGIEQDLQTKSAVVRHYISSGLQEKAEAILKEMEGENNLLENRQIRIVLLEHYAELGEADEVSRVWKVCEDKNPSSGEFIPAVRAWGKLKNIEKAEAVFEEMLKVVKKPTSLHYNSLLKVYTDDKMLEKGKDLIKRMAQNGIKVGPLTWDSLLKLYMEAGLVDKADEILQKAARQNYSRPMLFRSYLGIMDWYADHGDVHNAEKIFRRMREAGYTARFNQFQTLVRAYINAKQPAYGMRERMKADNLFPNKDLAAQLAKIDSFRKKTLVSDLLD